MFQSIWQDLQQQFRFGNRVTQLIIVNVIVFVVFGFLGLISRGVDGGAVAGAVEHFFAFSADWFHNLTHPWTIVTYAFLHAGLGHLFWNMILFYWFGRIVGDLIGDKYIVPLYFLGAIAGGFVYWATAAAGLYDGGAYIVGASASVMAFIVAAAIKAPEYIFRLLLLGEVRLKYVALAILLIDVFAFGTDGNTGGHFAHIGGMAMGYLFVTSLDNGRDLGAPINRVIDYVSDVFARLTTRRRPPAPRTRVAPRERSSVTASVARRASRGGTARRDAPAAADVPGPGHQDRLDEILDKIKASGIKSLTPEEREFLSQQSRR